MSQFRFSHFYFDNLSGILFAHYGTDAEQEVALRNKVANLLAYLLENRSRVVGKDELLSHLWQHGEYRENALTQSIRELRIALGDNAQQPEFVKTFPQRGYQWIFPIEEPSLEPLSAKPSRVAKPDTKKTPYLPWIIITAIVAISLFGLFYNLQNQAVLKADKSSIEVSNAAGKSLLILPFINETNDQSMAWLELGLADMLAVDMQRLFANPITPPAMGSTLLSNAELPWPALPAQIRILLKQQSIDAALFGTVRLHNSSQVFDFQLIYADGKTQQGSISFPSLPAETGAIGHQIKYLLDPGFSAKPLVSESDPLTAQAIAKGMQALQTGGAKDAIKYFDAAKVLSPNEYWAIAYGARSTYALGQWDNARKAFAQIPSAALDNDGNLNAFVAYWLAEISYRRGDADAVHKIEIAVDYAQKVNNINLMAKGYRLKAKVAWLSRDWETHNLLQTKANRLFGGDDSLAVQADRLFYLGNPSNIGLEQSPTFDYSISQKKLYKSLSFYRALQNQPMVAANLLAIAQNYSLPLEERELALNDALSLYRELAMPYELAQALIYAGFFQMQLHDGEKAHVLFSEANLIARALPSPGLTDLTHFYLAFATLDQGLDQSLIGRHGKNEDKLRDAVTQLEAFIRSSKDEALKASAWVFLGWANADLENFDLALSQLNTAKTLNIELGMDTTMGYAAYSIMRVYLTLGRYDDVVAMNDPITTRFQATFKARAYFELGNIKQAIATMESFRQSMPTMWQEEDALRLQQYKLAQQGNKITLIDEPKAHVVYCESDWVM